MERRVNRAVLLAGLLLLAGCRGDRPLVSEGAAVRACVTYHHVNERAQTKIRYKDKELIDVWISTKHGSGDCSVERESGKVIAGIWTGSR